MLFIYDETLTEFLPTLLGDVLFQNIDDFCRASPCWQILLSTCGLALLVLKRTQVS